MRNIVRRPAVLDRAPRARRALAALLALALSACSPLYVLRAGYEEAKILHRRRAITEMVADTATAPRTRAKLQLVLAARRFAQDSLHLEAGDSYTTYAALKSDTLAMIVSAAHKDRFQAYTWWFPIVGHVPYKGFFSEAKARKEARKLERKGLDTYVRPTAAFSTLGWFNDPLVSPLLRYDSVTLAGTVVHELLHNTLYVPGQAMFNESLAEFVGSRGAIAFFCAGAGAEGAECARARDDWHDELVFGRFLDGLVQRLDSLYSRADLDRDAKLRRREEIFAAARREFASGVQPQLRASSYAGFLQGPLNNATLISRRLYYHRLDLFESAYRRSGGDLLRTLEGLLAAARSDRKDPYGAVERWVAGAG